jgi:hypothetical protein
MRIHYLPEPSRDGFETFVFLGAFAFGFLGSFADRFCPLAIGLPLGAAALLFDGNDVGSLAEIPCEPFEELRASSPRGCASLKRVAHAVTVRSCGSRLVVLSQAVASFHGIFALLDHHKGVLGRCGRRAIPSASRSRDLSTARIRSAPSLL